MYTGPGFLLQAIHEAANGPRMPTVVVPRGLESGMSRMGIPPGDDGEPIIQVFIEAFDIIQSQG